MRTFRYRSPIDEKPGDHVVMTVGEAFYGQGFETGARLDVGGYQIKSYYVWLCVRTSPRTNMRLYCELVIA